MNPELNNVSNEVRNKRMNELIVSSIKNEPALFIKGLLKGLGIYLRDAVDFLPRKFRYLEVLMSIGSLMLIILLIRRKKYLDNPLLITLSVGFFLNLAFSPLLAQDGRQRVFAATIMLNALFYCAGLANLKKKKYLEIDGFSNANVSLCYIASFISLIGLGVLFTPYIYKEKKEYLSATGKCMSPADELLMNYRKGTSVFVKNDHAKAPYQITKKRLVEMSSAANMGDLKKITIAEGEYHLVSFINQIDGSYKFLRVENMPETMNDGIYTLCLESNGRAKLIN
jgi:hypothetical protein